MPSVTISSKYQVVIPRAVREALRIEPGQRVEVLAHEGRIEVIPLRPMPETRGFLTGIDTAVPRDDDRTP